MSRRLAALALLVLAAPAARAEESKLEFGGSGLSWAQTLIKKGQDQKALFGARAIGYATYGRFRLYGRADASRTQDGGAAEGSVSFSDLQSFSDLELYGALAYDLGKNVELVAVTGLAIPVDAGRPDLVTSHPKTLTVGFSRRFDYGTGAGFVLVTYGRHDAAGGEHFDKLVGTLQLPIKAGVYLVGDVVVNLGTRGASFSRTGLAYRF